MNFHAHYAGIAEPVETCLVGSGSFGRSYLAQSRRTRLVNARIAVDVTAEAAGAVILDSSLQKVDELLHIGRRMRRIALQSALGGMLLSVLGMLLAAAGYLPPVAGALAQEAIDVLAVLNALRAALPPKALSDC